MTKLDGFIEKADVLSDAAARLGELDIDSLNSGIKQLSQIDFAALNKAITDLSDAVQPLANFAKMFGKS